MKQKAWYIAPLIGGLIIVALLLFLFFPVDSSDSSLVPSVWSNLLPQALWGSLKLVVLVTLGTLILGVSSAWIVAKKRLPCHKFIERALVLPLTIPGYVFAFVYLSLFSYTGPVGTFSREVLGFNYFSWEAGTGSLRVALVMSLALFPYVYILAKLAFQSLSSSLEEAALMQAPSGWQMLRKFYLPMIWPWLVAALSLVIMETLADFGTVATFNYTSFTTAIYKAWFGYFSFSMASRLSLVLLFFVFLMFFSERMGRKKGRYLGTLGRDKVRPSSQKASLGEVLWISIVLLASLVIPVVQLLNLAFSGGHLQEYLNWGHLSNSLLVAGLGAFGLCAIALVLSLSWRNTFGLKGRWLFELNQMGYAIPGTVLAVALVQGLSMLGFSTGVSVGLSLTALVIGYSVRFVRVSTQPFITLFERLSPNVEEAARLLKENSWGVFRRVQWPLMKPALVVAFSLAFIEIVKEMPLTLMVRPFGWDTLAVKVFEFTSEGEWAMAAVPSLGILVIGILPSWWLSGAWKLRE